MLPTRMIGLMWAVDSQHGQDAEHITKSFEGSLTQVHHVERTNPPEVAATLLQRTGRPGMIAVCAEDCAHHEYQQTARQTDPENHGPQRQNSPEN